MSSLPTLLLVDDSEAVLAWGTAVLSSEFAVVTASDGLEALERLREVRPAIMVLDLSMPNLTGDEVLARLRRDEDPALRETPVIVMSSEVRRGEACLRAGAQAFLPKPARAEPLKELLHSLLREVEQRRRAGSRQLLVSRIGGRSVALPLEHVVTVVLHPATRPLSVGPSFVTDFVELGARRAAVIDMAGPLGTAHELPLWERKLVVLEREGALLALSFDRVLDPIEVSAERVMDRAALVPDERMLGRAVLGAASLPEGPVPMVDVAGLFSRTALRNLRAALAAVAPQAVDR
ncbi:MAG: response regulator [Myxococcota bacterium]